ncbi:MAG: AtpZ/AtpI family protein [candidate division Zixibacteria bacterium]|nr:AtpZ/AtpI family protein [candidate division Zixibacteria bacterium]
MSILGRHSKNDRDFRQISLLTTVPAILLAAPLIGYFIGWWLDGKLKTEPYMVTAGVLLGFVAAGFEIYHLVKKSAEIDKEKENDKKHTGS